MQADQFDLIIHTRWALADTILHFWAKKQYIQILVDLGRFCLVR